MPLLTTSVPFLGREYSVKVPDDLLIRFAVHGLKQKLNDAASTTANKTLIAMGYTSPIKFAEIRRTSEEDAGTALDAAIDAVTALVAAFEAGDFEAGERGDRHSSLARERLVADIKAQGITNIAFTSAKPNSKGRPTVRQVPFRDLCVAYAATKGVAADVIRDAYMAAVKPAYDAIIAAERAAAAVVVVLPK